MQNTNWEKAKPWVWQLLLFVLIGLIGWFGVRSFFSAIQAKMNAIQELSATQQHRVKQLDQLPELEKQHNLIVEKGRELDIILSKERLVEFIEELEALALANEVEIAIASRDNAFLESKITTLDRKEAVKGLNKEKSEETPELPKKGAAKETDLVTELPIKKFLKLSITLTGEYHAIVQYLNQLETMPFALDVVSLNMKEHLEEVGSVARESAVLNPFEETVPTLSDPYVSSPRVRLDATFETVVYMKD